MFDRNSAFVAKLNNLIARYSFLPHAPALDAVQDTSHIQAAASV
jgi:hypothetical protein